MMTSFDHSSILSFNGQATELFDHINSVISLSKDMDILHVLVSQQEYVDMLGVSPDPHLPKPSIEIERLHRIGGQDIHSVESGL